MRLINRLRESFWIDCCYSSSTGVIPHDCGQLHSSSKTPKNGYYSQSKGQIGDHVLMGCRASRVALMQNEYLLRKPAFRGNFSSPSPFRGQV
jgi:hypothetical protein